MYQAADLLFIYTETSLHAGAGAGTGAIDLPIQRDRVTGYPLVQASGLKGALRDVAEEKANTNSSGEDVNIIFGPKEIEQANEYAAAVSIGDARLLLFPVRSLIGVFAWITSPNALSRFKRDVQMVKGELPDELLNLPNSIDKEDVALVPTKCDLIPDNGNSLVLEEFAFREEEDKEKKEVVTKLAGWLSKHALPQNGEYVYWRDKLKTSLVILPDDAFRDFALYSTEVITRIKLASETKIVETGALWVEEYLPTDAVLYAPVFASKPRKKEDSLPSGWQGKDSQYVLQRARELLPDRLQLGGNETIGRGMVYAKWLNGGAK
jgi:CRISPR-associated protein Cmr4